LITAAAPLVSGAAAVIKAARPGLTAAQYRSLLVNSAAPVSFPVQWTGAGFLNVSAALASTVAVSPVSLSFGTGANTVDTTRELTITNLAEADDTFTLSVSPAAGATLSLTADSVRIAAAASQTIPVRLGGSALSSGEYQGTVRIRGTQSGVDAVVPYWYGVPDRIPKFVAQLAVPYAGSPDSAQDIYFRVTDLAGLPLPDAAPVVKVVGGFGSILGLQSLDGESPGVFHAIVLLGPQDGPNEFEIDAGPASGRITIQGQTQ
jgi:hypothetical protein